MAFEHAGEINELIIIVIRLLLDNASVFSHYITICVIDCVDHIPYGSDAALADFVVKLCCITAFDGLRSGF